MINRLRHLARLLLHPFPEPPLLPGHFFSPTDSLAERLSGPLTEHFFRDSMGAGSVVRIVGRCLDDPAAELALKKAWQRLVENRMRAIALTIDPSEDHGFDPISPGPLTHPMDPALADEISRALPGPTPNRKAAPVRIAPRSSVLGWLSLLVWCAITAIQSTAIGLRWGRRRIEPIHAKVASTEFFDRSFWEAFRSACQEYATWSDDALLILRDGGQGVANVGQVVEVSRLHVPSADWMRRVAVPCWRMIPPLMATAVRYRSDPRVVELARLALNLVAVSFGYWRTGFNVRCRYCMDVADYSVQHNLRAIVFRKFGIGLVRLPHSSNENPGYSYSFLDYALLLEGGPYLSTTYGRTWSHACRTLPVGLFRNDRRLRARFPNTPDWASKAEQRLRRGHRMVAFFCNNDEAGHREGSLAVLRALWECLRDKDQWFLMIKPKKPHARGGFLDRALCTSGVKEAAEDGRVIVSDLRVDGLFVPASWMIERMDFGVTAPGSVQIEALSLGKPILTYFPVIQDTPATRFLRDAGLCFSGIAAFRAAVERHLNNPGVLPVPTEWIRETFDAFGDDCALDRIIEVLYAPELGRSASPELAVAK